MLLDALLQFDINTGAAITVTRDSTNELDMAHQRDMGAGDMVLDVFCQVIQAFTAAGAATLTVELKAARNNGGVAGTYYTQMSSVAYAVAQLTAGRELLRAPLPSWDIPASGDTLNVPRFYKLTYTVATGPMTAGTIAAYLMPHNHRQNNRAYPNNYTAA